MARAFAGGVVVFVLGTPSTTRGGPAPLEARLSGRSDGDRARALARLAVAPLSADALAWGWEAVIALADHGTYAAKRLGRNAWVGYAGGDRESPPAVATLSPDQIETWVAEGRLRRENSAGGPARVAA